MPSLLVLSLQFKLDSNLVRKMKSTTCLHLKSPVRKRGVERAKLKFKNYFREYYRGKALGGLFPGNSCTGSIFIR